LSVNDAASSAGTEPASSAARSAIDVEMKERHSTKTKRMEKVVVAVAVAAVGAE